MFICKIIYNYMLVSTLIWIRNMFSEVLRSSAGDRPEILKLRVVH